MKKKKIIFSVAFYLEFSNEKIIEFFIIFNFNIYLFITFTSYFFVNFIYIKKKISPKYFPFIYNKLFNHILIIVIKIKKDKKDN